MLLLILALLGIGISAYAYVVEYKLRKDPLYKPVCDISERISCSKPLLSPYANLLGISNAALALAYYFLVAMLALLNADKTLTVVSILGCIASLFFAYVLYFKIRTVCLMCTALYILNFAILAVAIFK
jgi:vitamin-K-epoxide reductase (warfarin-sensitive)